MLYTQCVHLSPASIALSMCNKQDQSNCLSQVSGGCLRPSLGKVGVIMVLNNPRHRMPSFFLCAMMRALLRPGQRLHIIWRANHPPHLGSHFITTIQLGAPPYGIWLPGTRVSLHSAAFQILLRMFMKGLPCVGYFLLDLSSIIVWRCQYPSFRHCCNSLTKTWWQLDYSLTSSWSKFDNRLSCGHIDDGFVTNWWQVQDNIILVYWCYHFHLYILFLQIH